MNLDMMRTCLPLPLLLAVLFANGCADRTYLTRSHGRAYSEAFGRQAVPPKENAKVSATEATEGLDSQEASAVSRSYRQSLSGKEGGGEGSGHPNVIMNGPVAPTAAYLPPPSVPGGQ